MLPTLSPFGEGWAINSIKQTNKLKQIKFNLQKGIRMSMFSFLHKHQAFTRGHMAKNKNGFVRRLWHEDSLNQLILIIECKGICRYICRSMKEWWGMVFLSMDRQCISLTGACSFTSGNRMQGLQVKWCGFQASKVCH